MQQSNNKKRENTAFIYVRLSRDDELSGESYSISNQKKLLTKIAKEKGYTNLVVYCDDGVSGVTMNRPDFTKMIQQIELGKAAAVFVKDLSRLGRNYIEVGRLVEEFFPEHDVRLVAVSDNVDTNEGENEMMPIRNLFNEWYSRDISKKRRISNKIKGSSGVPLGPPPYGYIKDPQNLKQWKIDPEAAEVVRRIFYMRLEGLGNEQIATILTKEKILTPSEYAKSKGIKKSSAKTTADPYYWRKSTVSYILNTQEYCGDVINFKTYSISYKNKRRRENSEENRMVFKDVHDAVVERDVFEKVLSMNKTNRKRLMKSGEHSMFSGVLRCADCGKTLHYHFNQQNPDIKYFNCPGYNKGKRKDCFTTHYIRQDFLEEVVMSEIRRLTRFAVHHEEEFIMAVNDFSKQVINKHLETNKIKLRGLYERDREIDRLFEKIYEDNVKGKLSDERFKKLSKGYDDEQKEISEQIYELNIAIEELECKKSSTDGFVSAVKKYTRAKKLTPLMLNELINYIEVYHAERIEGVKTQKIIIHYNCIGTIEIPEELSIPEPEIEIQTRKGVMLSYQ